MILKNLGKGLIGKAALAAALLFILMAPSTVFAQGAEIRNAGVYYYNGNTEINDVYCNWEISKTFATYTSVYRGAVTNNSAHHTNDPWDTSALIEYDQPYPSPTATNNYPNHCLGLCFDVYCTNKPSGATTYSISFPLQKARFEIAKYNNSKDIVNRETNPAVRTIDMSIYDNKINSSTTNEEALANFMCAGYSCYGSASSFEDTQTCPNPDYECELKQTIIDDGDTILGTCASWDDATYCCRELNSTSKAWRYAALHDVNGRSDPTKKWLDYLAELISRKFTGDTYVPQGKVTIGTAKDGYVAGDYIDCGYKTNCAAGIDSEPCKFLGGEANGRETPCIVRAGKKNGKGYNEPIRFCSSWDGSYEILGEFGKTNGQFGFRANVSTKYPGDGIVVEDIEIDDTYIYPGDNQYPIQVDVTNVHTVRTTPTVIGKITPVQAAPYAIAYRISKDADVLIKIYDASTTNPTRVVRHLVKWDPRLGEGMLGSDKDKPIVESDIWDGRDDNGRLLPAGNYIVSVQAKSNDEWPGTDYSRAVTRQLSLDPLKLTDITTRGLSKQSTAYATINYVPTEASNVYFEVYTPGTTFTTEYTNGNAATGTSPAPQNGVRVYHSMQERSRGMSYVDKWDGYCHETNGCAIPYPAGSVHPLTGVKQNSAFTVTFANGQPLPDGDYVYVLWAEIPYTDNYTNQAGETYRAVKTQLYYIGLLPVERGVVDITIQPVGYSTIGSSPTVYGLDPFIFKFSTAREALVNAYVKNTAGITVKTLTNKEGTNGTGVEGQGGNVSVAQQMNTYSWDGLDDYGRMVGPGTYLFVVETSDPMFPNSVKTHSEALFPVDLYRVTDVYTTDVYGDTNAKATINYSLSKAMNVQINIYNKDVVIPAQTNVVSGGNPAEWPPRVCNRSDDSAFFTGSYVDPAKNPTCIYVNDKTFTNYPANRTAAEYKYEQGDSYNETSVTQTLDVRLQPIKTFNRSALRTGNGFNITEEWDAQYFYNPTSTKGTCTSNTNLTTCPYEMVPDGTYPFYLVAMTDEPTDIYYNRTTGEPFRQSNQVITQTGLYATEKPVYRINITRGPVYFLDGSVVVYPNAPQLFNTSSGPILVPPYEINFAISRAATVEVAIVALQPNMCTTTREIGTPYSQLVPNNKAGDVCKYLSTMTIVNSGTTFDPNMIRRIYWDGTDNNGKYVKNGNYEIRLTAKNYPDQGLYQPTIKQFTQSVNLLQVFDLPDSESYAINKRGEDMKISYQLSVPMKVALQIFKPGTTIYDYQKGTLRDPSTGREVRDIREVLVKSIVGIRPSTTLIEEIWDGTDYANQEVPDGTYPFRYVTALNSADIDSITGEIVGANDSSTDKTKWSINKVADTYQYVNLHHATVAIGDGQFVCEDWEKTVFFYPNPFNSATGTMEITKLPVPGTVSMKLYNLAGDLVREGGYTCVDAQNMRTTMSDSLDVKPDNNVSNVTYNGSQTGGRVSIRNAALRCFWDKTNGHGKRVARGVYFGLVDFRAQNGRQHCQKVVKILIPR